MSFEIFKVRYEEMKNYLISVSYDFQFFICSMSFATFTISTDLPQFRLQTSFILLLTTVTFKFVVNQSLPRISYLTYMVKLKPLR